MYTQYKSRCDVSMSYYVNKNNYNTYGGGLTPKLSQTRSNVSQSMRFTSDVARHFEGGSRPTWYVTQVTIRGAHVVREPRVYRPTRHVNPGFQKLMGQALLRRLCSTCSILSWELDRQALSENINFED